MSNTILQAPWEVPGIEYPKGWPEKGQVEFANYATRYRPGLDLVLNGINFKVNPAEKVISFFAN